MSKRSTTSLFSERLTKFERGVVFRVARGYFLLLAVLAVVLFIGGALFGARGLSKTEVPPPTLPGAPAARAPLSLQAVQAEADRVSKRAQQAASSIDVKPSPGQAVGAVDPEEAQLDAVVAKLRALFPDPPYSWDNEIEKTCTAPSAFGCMQWGSRVKRYGVVGAISNEVKGMDRSEVIDYLTVVCDVLKGAPVEKRLDLVGPTIVAEQRARADHKAMLAKHKKRVEEIQSTYESEVQTNNAMHSEWRQLGVYGLGFGFALLITVSLFLAFLSMERHTRALEKLVSSRLMPNGGSDGAD